MDKQNRKVIAITTIIATAASVGTASSMALDNIVLSVGIPIFITSIIAVGLLMAESRSKAKRNSN